MKLTEAQALELEEQFQSVTDKTGMLFDLVIGKGFKPVFHCSHSGLFYPGDYGKNWGRKYGIGLGPTPVSEALDTDYDTDPPDLGNRIRRPEQIMHPVGPFFAKMDFLVVHPLVAGTMAVAAEDDPDMFQRVPILRAKQLANPKGRIKMILAQKGVI